MKNKGVCEVIPKEKIPERRGYVKSKWEFKINRSKFFSVRLVACGYRQVPGIDFTESYAPVINDVSFRVILTEMMVWNLKAKIIDIETTLLHSDLEESIEVCGSKFIILKK
jgi:hypothetical protein